MIKRMTAMLAAFMIMLSFGICLGETVIYTRRADGITQTITISLEEGFSEESTAAYLQRLQIISQRDPRFATDEYRYVRRETFDKNGCGPASVHNALAAIFGIEDAEVSNNVLKEILSILAYMHNPAEYGINYDQIQNLLTADYENYPTLAGLFGSVDRVTYIGAATAQKVMKQVQAGSDDLFLMGRLCLNTSMAELID